MDVQINKNDSGQRLDKFLTKKFKALPMSLLYKYIRVKRIKINGKRTKENYILCENDILNLFIPEEFYFDGPRKKVTASKPINVRYEDENILIVNKEKGLLCHSDEADTENATNGGDTLIDRITYYLTKNGEYNPNTENTFAPSLCNRIDRNTEGLVIAAKNAESLRIMNEIIKNREIHKTYLAAVHGIFEKKSGRLTDYLYKDKKENKVYLKSSPTKDTVTAILEYKVSAESKSKNLSLLEITLLTGRTHQIRAQMANASHPLLGDGKYAVNREDRKIGYSSQALCSYSVTFDFSTPKGILDYLNGVTIKTEKPEFVKLFY